MKHPLQISKYINQVLDPATGAGALEVLSVQRFLRDVDNAVERGWIFDRKAADRALNFFGFLNHGNGKDFAGRPFVLEGWQAFGIYNKYGWKKADGRRRFLYGYLDVARKNGKTTLAAGEDLYLLGADGEPSAEIYSVATKRDQASIALKEAKNILKYSRRLRDHYQTLAHAITVEQAGASFRSLSSDSSTLDGLNPHGVTVDEFHAHRDSGLIDVMRSAMGSRSQPMMNIITTAGFNKQGPCFAFRDVAIKVLNGVMDQDDLFIQIFTLDDVDDHENPAVWRKANPNLGVSLRPDFLEGELVAAQNNPSNLTNFLTKHMNRWVDAAQTWIPDADFMACNHGTVEPEPGAMCWGGLDLSSNRDITALAFAFRTARGVAFWWRFYIPADNVQQRVKRDRVPYDVWIRQGWLTTTPGNVTDYNFIKADVVNFCERWDVQMIAFDRWNSSQLVIDLTEQGIPMDGFGQGFGSMSAPTKEWERLVLTDQMNHGGNPVVRWMQSNVALQRDAAGNIKPDKAKSIEKIDGIVAAIMALGAMMDGKSKEPDINKIYKDQGIRTL